MSASSVHMNVVFEMASPTRVRSHIPLLLGRKSKCLASAMRLMEKEVLSYILPSATRASR